MKELLILRHAKSSWDSPELDDHDRPLNKRGKRDAPRMGVLLRSERMLPGMIIASTAERAKTTARLVAEASGFAGELRTTRRLYLADPDDYLELLAELSDEIDSVMVVGHNPGLEELVERLTGSREVMPTAALARVALKVDTWGDLLGKTRGRLVGLWRPKELPARH